MPPSFFVCVTLICGTVQKYVLTTRGLILNYSVPALGAGSFKPSLCFTYFEAIWGPAQPWCKLEYPQGHLQSLRSREQLFCRTLWPHPYHFITLEAGNKARTEPLCQLCIIWGGPLHREFSQGAFPPTLNPLNATRVVSCTVTCSKEVGVGAGFSVPGIPTSLEWVTLVYAAM